MKSESPNHNLFSFYYCASLTLPLDKRLGSMMHIGLRRLLMCLQVPYLQAALQYVQESRMNVKDLLLWYPDISTESLHQRQPCDAHVFHTNPTLCD